MRKCVGHSENCYLYLFMRLVNENQQRWRRTRAGKGLMVDMAESEREKYALIHKLCARMGSGIKKTASKARRNKLNGDEWAEGEWVEATEKRTREWERERSHSQQHNATNNPLRWRRRYGEWEDNEKTHINLLTWWKYVLFSVGVVFFALAFAFIHFYLETHIRDELQFLGDTFALFLCSVRALLILYIKFSYLCVYRFG